MFALFYTQELLDDISAKSTELEEMPAVGMDIETVEAQLQDFRVLRKGGRGEMKKKGRKRGTNRGSEGGKEREEERESEGEREE